MSHSHAHAGGRAGEKRRLIAAVVLTTVIMVAEGVGGWISNSLALMSDAGHMLTDVTALLIALLAVGVASRKADRRRTFGYYRLEILAALANGVLLGVLAIYIGYEAWHRFNAPEPVDTATVLAVGSIGLTANVLGLLLLRRHSSSMSTKGAYFHVLGDTASSVAVIVAALVIHYTGWTIVDPILSVVIALIIIYGSIRLIRECVDVLLTSVPLGLEIEAVQHAIEEVPGVVEVHDIHVWTITSGMVTFSCHVRVEGECSLPDCDRILSEIKERLAQRFEIHHSTIQLEGEAYEEVGMVH